MESRRTIKPELLDLSVPALKKAVPTDEFISMLREVLKNRYPVIGGKRTTCDQARYRRTERIIDRFKAFLGERRSINPDEALLADFLEHISNQEPTWSESYKKRHRQDIRDLINALPESALKRPVLRPAQIEVSRRFDHLSKNSVRILRDFLKNGRTSKNRHGKSPRLSSTMYSPNTRDNAVSRILTAAKTLKLKDITTLSREHVEELFDIYGMDGQRDTAIKMLHDCKCLYRYLWATAVIQESPLDEIEYIYKPNRDYVPADGIEKLADLTTVNMHDFIDVRNRLICFCLLYDFALRAGEVAALKVSDIGFDHEYAEMTLRGEIQKGQNKPTVVLCNCFDASRTLMKQYLRLRWERSPQTDALLIGSRHRGISTKTCNEAVKEQCRRLDIVTHEGNEPACHRLRHSFGTLNVDPLGLEFSIFDIMERLRHKDYKTTKATYIDNNPLIQKERHIGRMRRAKGNTRTAATTTIPPDLSIADSDINLPESDALDMLSKFGITKDALRKTAEQDGKRREDDRQYFYSRAYIEDLSKNWISKHKAAQILGMTNKKYWHWVSGKDFERKVIGKASLIRATDIVGEIEERVAV